MARVIQTVEVEIDSRTVYELLKRDFPELFRDVDFASIAAMEVSVASIIIRYQPTIHENQGDVPERAGEGEALILAGSSGTSADEPGAMLRVAKIEEKPKEESSSLIAWISLAAAAASLALLFI